MRIQFQQEKSMDANKIGRWDITTLDTKIPGVWYTNILKKKDN